MSRQPWIVLGVILAGCIEAAPAPDPEVSSRGDLGPMDAIARRFGRVRRRMTARGYGNAIALERTFALEGGGVAFPIDLPLGSCSTFVALGGGGIRDLRLTLYDGDGAELSIDSVPAEAGLVHVCPEGDPSAQTLVPYHLTMQAIQGSGGIVAASFESDPGVGEGFEGLFDGVLAPPAPFLPVEEALAAARVSLRDRGLVEGQAAEFARLAEGQVVRAAVELEQGRCLAVVARSTEGLRDVDMYLFGPNGTEVARELGIDSEPQLEYCAESSGTATLELRAFEGSGALGWMVWSSDAPEALPTEAPPVVETAEPLEQLGRELRALLDREYRSPLVIVRDGTISPGEGRSHEIQIGPGCGVVLGAAGPGDLDLDLYLQTPDGEIADRDTRIRATARVAVCTEDRAVYRVVVKGYGRGEYALAQVNAPASILDVATLRAETPAASLIARGYEDMGPLETLGTARASRAIDFGDASCVALVVAGDRGVEDIDLFVLDSNGTRVLSDTGPAPWARLAVCADEHPAAERFDIVPYRGEGEVVVRTLIRGGP